MRSRMALILSSSGPDCDCDVGCDVCDCELEDLEDAFAVLVVDPPFLSLFAVVLCCWQLLATVCDRSQSPSIFWLKNNNQNVFSHKWPND